jgi:hypothetical protein
LNAISAYHLTGLSSPVSRRIRVTITTYDEIARLYAAYCQCLDNGDHEGWATLFTDDGLFRGEGRPDVVGRQALRDFAAARNGSGIMHITSNLLLPSDLDVDGHIAATADFLIVSCQAGSTAAQITAMGRYADTISQTHDGPKFASRIVSRVL